MDQCYDGLLPDSEQRSGLRKGACCVLDLTFLTLLPGRMCSHGHSMLKQHQGITWAMMTAAPSFTAASTSSRVLT